MSKLRIANLGGLNRKYLFEKDGKTWMFKESVEKFTGIPISFRAYVQEAAYRVQNIVDPVSAIPCFVDKKDGMFGASQQYIDVEKGSVYGIIDNPSPELMEQIMREYITDYLLNHYDTHERNFIIGKDGIFRGVDKEQSFRFSNERRAQKPTYDYDPNGTGVMYDDIFQRYIRGSVDIDFSVFEKYIARVESVPTKEYMEFFDGYIKHIDSRFPNIEKFIRSKKETIREQLGGFVQTLESERDL